MKLGYLRKQQTFNTARHAVLRAKQSKKKKKRKKKEKSWQTKKQGARVSQRTFLLVPQPQHLRSARVPNQVRFIRKYFYANLVGILG
jgi:hypothetical protein